MKSSFHPAADAFNRCPIMKTSRRLVLWAFIFVLSPLSIALGEDAPFPETAEIVRKKTIDIDGTRHELSEAAKKTLEILRTEKFETIKIDRIEPQKTFEILKAFLAKRGVTIRLKHYLTPQVYEVGEPVALQNIPAGVVMWYLDQIVHWGWIIYPDGSITYFDNQCACCWPKNFACHASQYEAGKPEVMAKEQNAENKEGRSPVDPPME